MDDNFAARGTLHRPFWKQAGHPTRGEAGREREAQGRAGTFGDKDAAVDEGGDDAASLYVRLWPQCLQCRPEGVRR